MRNNKDYRKHIKNGIIKLTGGIVLATAIPISFGVCLGNYFANTKNYDNYINEVQSTAIFQEAKQNELKNLETKLNNSEIEINDYQTNKDFVESKEFVVNYAKDNYPDIYQGILKSSSSVTKMEFSSIITGVLTAVEVLVTAAVGIGDFPGGLNVLIDGAVDEFKNAARIAKCKGTYLKGHDEHLPEVDLE